jgi:hypothetical protein
VPLVLDAILGRGLKQATQTMEARGNLRHPSYPQNWDATADGGRHDDLSKMHDRDPALGLISSKEIEDACLRLVNYWRTLTDLDLSMSAEDLIATPAWKSVTRATTYLAYLHGGSYYKRRRSKAAVDLRISCVNTKTGTEIHQKQ